jgi:hypothetical protein
VQYRLGLKPFLAGLWVNQWKEIQTAHHHTHKIKRSVDLWFNRLLHLIQAFPIIMWTARNKILHSSGETNYILQAQHTVLDEIIETIFNTIPPQRAMAHCDIAFFKKFDRAKIKKMKLRRKNNWITSANLILTKYDSTTAQSQRFLSYFQRDRG